MTSAGKFQKRGIVEGFFGPPWSMPHRARIFEFGAARGMNTYLYAPKDDPYHRERWKEPYPPQEWRELADLVRLALHHKIDFVYGFHPGRGLHFSDKEPVRILLDKARRFYNAGVRTFAVLFDDIPSRLEHEEDRKHFGESLARAEGLWVKAILDQQPPTWTDVEWWICPSRYTEDPLLEQMFGCFESDFLEILARHLPENVACLWTGPSVVSRAINLDHVRKWARSVPHRLILWDNYPVNDLGMSRQMHLSPLQGRDPRLSEKLYGYLNNPLLQESLSFIPLATCFDYASDPARYDPEKSWERLIAERFGKETLPYWRAIRQFCERTNKRRSQKQSLSFTPLERRDLEGAFCYVQANPHEGWCQELRLWFETAQRTPQSIDPR
jgi:hyaluronoglucosaminidase